MPLLAESELRDLILDRLSGGEPVARSELLECAARRAGVEPIHRGLRAEVSRAVRKLLEDGSIADLGPEVYLKEVAKPH